LTCIYVRVPLLYCHVGHIRIIVAKLREKEENCKNPKRIVAKIREGEENCKNSWDVVVPSSRFLKPIDIYSVLYI
jgi:hypothetical protein